MSTTVNGGLANGYLARNNIATVRALKTVDFSSFQQV
jgi:hypothetical protein